MIFMANLQQQVNDMQREIDNIKRQISQNNFSNLQVFTKQVQLKGGVAPVQDSTGVTTVAGLITLLKNLNILK